MLAATILTLAGTAAAAEPALPVRLSDADPHWRLAESPRTVGPDLTLAAIATHAGAADRLLFLRAPEAVAADAFVHAITAAFSHFTCSGLQAQDAKCAGFVGRDWRFALANARGRLDCELFVFTDDRQRWGILYSRPRETPDASAAVFGLLLPQAPPPPDTVALQPVRIRNTPLTTFPISLRVASSAIDARVATITITAVPRDSEAEDKGIRVGDAIVAIDGRPVAEFPAGVAKDDPLGRIFMNRRPGDKVTLELRSPGDEKTYTVTLHTIWGGEADSPFRDFRR